MYASIDRSIDRPTDRIDPSTNRSINHAGAVYDAFRAGMASGGGEEGAHARGLEALVEDEMVKEASRSVT